MGNYVLHIDDLYLTIDRFNENLDGLGNLNFNVSAATVDFSKSSFTSLIDIKEAMADGALNLSITNEGGSTVWASSNYSLSSANLSVGDNGTSFYANFYIPKKETATEDLEAVDATPVV